MRLFSALLLSLLAIEVHATDFSKIFSKVDPAVVVIRTKESAPRLTNTGVDMVRSGGLGSGVIISADGLIMTASHVVNNADDLRVETIDGKLHKAKILSTSVATDLALIQFETVPDKLTFIKPGDSNKVTIGQEVFVVGAPYGLKHTLTVGHLSARRINSNDKNLVDTEFLQTDAAVNQGNSGGPLFTTSGKLIGIVSHINTQSGGNEGLGFAASINMAKKVLLEEAPIWFGVEMIPLHRPLIGALNIPYTEGLLVQRVAKGSFGDSLNIRPGTITAKINQKDILLGGDVVVEVGGDTIYRTRKGRERINTYLSNIASGNPIEITVIREGKKVKLTATKP